MAEMTKERLLLHTAQHEAAAQESFNGVAATSSEQKTQSYDMIRKTPTITVNTDMSAAINSVSFQSRGQGSPFFRPPPLKRSASASSRMLEFVGSKLA
eukprot:326781_1